MRDEDGVPDEFQEARQNLRDLGFIRDHLVGDMVDAGRGLGDVHLRVDEFLETRDDAPILHQNRADLDDAVIPRGEAGGFGIEYAITASF